MLCSVSEDVSGGLIADLSQQITKQWTLVAAYLGLQNDKIDALDAENNSVTDKIIAMLNAWKRQMGKSVTRSSLMKALVKANRKDLADKVRIMPANTNPTTSAVGTVKGKDEGEVWILTLTHGQHRSGCLMYMKRGHVSGPVSFM